MAISSKGKRKIIVNSKTWYWWVFWEMDQTEFDGIQIKVIPENQSTFIKYGMQQQNEKRFVAIALKNYSSGVQVHCPKFENEDGNITPNGVRELIEWCCAVPDENNIRVARYAQNNKKGILKGKEARDLLSEIVKKLS
ncbi:MAG: hypothetical protein K0S32_3153 [Bacteroidetes bacterium]|jgi:hypothetical protein|nr:hypothetical protein [Bacteroidota bacterium]